MPAIHHLFTINASADVVFKAITLPKGLNNWWTVDAAELPELRQRYRFFFSEDYDWYAEVVKVIPNQLIHWQMKQADEDWLLTQLIFELEEKEGTTTVRFQHKDWLEINDHFRRTSYCWVFYFQKMRQYLEQS